MVDYFAFSLLLFLSGFGLAHRWLAFFRNYVHLFRIIAANVRTAAVCFRAGDSPEFHAAPLMRDMDGCALLAAVFAHLTCRVQLLRSTSPENSLAFFLATQHFNPKYTVFHTLL